MAVGCFFLDAETVANAVRAERRRKRGFELTKEMLEIKELGEMERVMRLTGEMKEHEILAKVNVRRAEIDKLNADKVILTSTINLYVISFPDFLTHLILIGCCRRQNCRET